MVVEDSLVTRMIYARMLKSEVDMEIVESVSTAEAAIAALPGGQVDIILLDLNLPGMSGLEAIPHLIKGSRGARILVISNLTDDGAAHSLAALEKGATDTLPKPASGTFDAAYRDMFVAKLRDVSLFRRARVAPPRVAAVLGNSCASAAPAASSAPPVVRINRPRLPVKVLAIGASTGGIHALSTLFEFLTEPLGIPILLTQHLPAALMPTLARQLATATGMPAVVAEDGMPLLSGRIHIAPGDAHMTITGSAGDLRVHLDSSASVSGCMPSVDPMFASLAACMGDRVLGIVLSGMGKDGVRGARKLVDAGGAIIAQDRPSSAVWGMPRAIVEAGLAIAIVPPERMAQHIMAGVRPGLFK